MPDPASRHIQSPATRTHSRLVLAAVGLTGALCGLLAWLAIGWGGWQPEQPPFMPWLREAVFALALGGPVGLIALVIAHLKSLSSSRSEVLLQESQQRRGNLQLLDLLPVPVALSGTGVARAQINKAMAELSGVERGDALDLPWNWQHLVVAQDWLAWAGAMEAARQTGRPQWLQARMRAGDAEHEVLTQFAPIADANPAGTALAVVLRQAHDAAAQQAILHLQKLLEMAEAEKWLFGQAVHDELGQRLSGIAYFAKTLQRKLEGAKLAEADDAGWLTHLANESMSVARGLARGLVPVGTDDPGALAATLAELCLNTSKMFSAHCTLQADEHFEPGGAGRANHLFHAVQELVTNAIKHGAAHNVQVRLEVSAVGQRVSVRNDGVELADGASARRPGMGLNGVRSRVAHLGGQFTLADEAGGGVVACIDLPILPGVPALPITPDAAVRASPGATPGAAGNRRDA